jgi:hypothetical protein
MPKIHKKPYTLPTFRRLDAEAAKAELQAKVESDDPRVQKILRAIDQTLSAKKNPESSRDKPA